MWYIYFIDENKTPLLQLAYTAISGLEGTNVNWYTPDKITKKFKTYEKNCSFIFSFFEGPLFKYLQDMNMAIFGPQMLLDYLRSDDILPKMGNPLFSTALKGVIVCFTGFSEEDRNTLGKKVLMMHGTVIKDLTVSVNVLVSSTVGTKKLRVAAAKGIKVVLKDWIAEMWELSSNTDPISALDNKLIEKYRIPIFYNLKICVSGLSVQERDEANTIISKNGGQYLKELIVGKCTHLICKYPNGQKYNYAEKWKIQTVSWKWLFDSIEKGYVLDENDYQLDGKAHVSGSTPVIEARKNYDIENNDFSTISVSGPINETIIYDDDEDPGIEFKSYDDRGIWTDCVIGFIDCDSEFIDKWADKINKNGGKCCFKDSETITHIIVGNPLSLKEKENGIVYVNSDWLQACLDEKMVIYEDSYIIKIQSSPFNNTDSMDLNNWDSMDQYLDENIVKLNLQNDRDGEETVIDNDSTFNEEPTNLGLFNNSKFFLMDSLTNEQSKLSISLITENYGVVVTDPLMAKYQVVPEILFHSIKSISKSSQFVTVFFLEMCVQNKSFLSIDSDFMYHPLIVESNNDKKILTGCVFSFSGYPINERKLLKSISTQFGAVVQDQMARKTIENKHIMATTHLIIGKADKKKLPSSKKWHIPAVTKQWIGACILQKNIVNVSSYILQEDDMSIMTTSDVNNINETFLTNIDVPDFSVVEDFRSPELNNKHLQIRNCKKIGMCTGDLSSPMMRLKYEGPGKIDISMFKTPEYSYHKYQKQVDDIGTPEMEKALKSRLALLNIAGENLMDKYLDISLSETSPRLESEPLKSATIFVSESALSQRVKLEQLINSLGGECTKLYNSETVTHVVCGKEQSHNSQELRKAKLDNKTIVNCDWLHQCYKEQKCVPTCHYDVNVNMDDSVNCEGSRDSMSRKRKANEELFEISNKIETRPGIKMKHSNEFSEKETVKWDYKDRLIMSKESTENISSSSQRIIMLSGIDKDYRELYRVEVTKLGGALNLAEELSMEVTHLICLEPGRNSKYLSAIASGKWVLHDSYMKESIKAERWLDESLFEWGGPKTSDFISATKSLNQHELSLAAAAKHRRESGGQAFKDWKVCIIDKPDKVDKLGSIIKCGGGIVIPSQPMPNQKEVTHMLVNKNFCSQATYLSEFPCYKIELISYFLACRNDLEVKKIIKKFIIDSPENMKAATKITKALPEI